MKRHGGREKERSEERRGSEGGREKGDLQEAYQANSAVLSAWEINGEGRWKSFRETLFPFSFCFLVCSPAMGVADLGTV